MPKKKTSLDEIIAREYVSLFNLLSRMCQDQGIRIAKEDIIKDVLLESLLHYHKDISRINEHQNGDVSPQTRIGFLVFWLCKLKPIRVGSHNIADVNERASLRAAHYLLRNLPFKNNERNEISSLPGTVDHKADRLARAFNFYMRLNANTLLYSIRHRNLTGDAITLVFGAVIRMAHFPEA